MKLADIEEIISDIDGGASSNIGLFVYLFDFYLFDFYWIYDDPEFQIVYLYKLYLI